VNLAAQTGAALHIYHKGGVREGVQNRQRRTSWAIFPRANWQDSERFRRRAVWVSHLDESQRRARRGGTQRGGAEVVAQEPVQLHSGHLERVAAIHVGAPVKERRAPFFHRGHLVAPEGGGAVVRRNRGTQDGDAVSAPPQVMLDAGEERSVPWVRFKPHRTDLAPVLAGKQTCFSRRLLVQVGVERRNPNAHVGAQVEVAQAAAVEKRRAVEDERRRLEGTHGDDRILRRLSEAYGVCPKLTASVRSLRLRTDAVGIQPGNCVGQIAGSGNMAGCAQEPQAVGTGTEGRLGRRGASS